MMLSKPVQLILSMLGNGENAPHIGPRHSILSSIAVMISG